jgi:hypothetical protein
MEPSRREPIGSVVAALLGLLAFILAFTFDMAASRFETRKELLLSEVNAIRTASMRAALLPEPERTEARELIREYVDVRLEAVQDPSTLRQAIERSESLQDRLWAHAVTCAEKSPESSGVELFAESMNDVVDYHTKRLTVGIMFGIPAPVWIGLIFVATLSTATVGYEYGLAGASILRVALVLALTLSTVIWLIADLDTPLDGLIQVNHQPLVELRQKLE